MIFITIIPINNNLIKYMHHITGNKRPHSFDPIPLKDTPDSIMELILVPEVSPPPHMKARKVGEERDKSVAVPIAQRKVVLLANSSSSSCPALQPAAASSAAPSSAAASSIVAKKEFIITPLAIDILDLLRCAFYVITPNERTLSTDSPINSFRTQKIMNKYSLIDANIACNQHAKQLATIISIFSEVKQLIEEQSTNPEVYVTLAARLKILIQNETGRLKKIKEFPGNPFLVCLSMPPSKMPSGCISPEMLNTAKRVYTLFERNVKIETENPEFLVKIKMDMKILIGLIASNSHALNAFNKIFLKKNLPLTIKEDSRFLYTRTTNCISIKDVPFITIPATNREINISTVTDPLEFQTREFSLFWLYHEIIHHMVLAMDLPVPIHPLLNTRIWTDNEELKVIATVNSLRKQLSMPIRTRHTEVQSYLQPLASAAAVGELVFSYLSNKKITSILDLEHRSDLSIDLKPRRVLNRLKQRFIVHSAPALLKHHFKALGYCDQIEKEELIALYQLAITEDSKIINTLLLFLTIPFEVFPELFESSVTTNKMVQKALTRHNDIFKKDKSGITYAKKLEHILTDPEDIRILNERVAHQLSQREVLV